MEIPKGHEISSVTLTPKTPNPIMVFEFVSDWETHEYRDEIIFHRPDWDVSIETKPTEKFQKVEEILERRFTGAKSYHGGEVVTEILEALGL